MAPKAHASGTRQRVFQQDSELAQRIGVRALILKPNTVEELADKLQEIFRQSLDSQAVG